MKITDPLDLPLMRALRFHPNELGQYDRERDQPKYEPTPEQIREATAEIRRGWSKQVERARRGEPDRRYLEIREVIVPEFITEKEVRT